METYNSNNKEHTTNNDLVSWIQDSLKGLNTEFPLSGGEQEEDLTAPEETATEHKGFLDNLDTNFPLSGGKPGDE